MRDGKDRNQSCKRREDDGPIFFAEHFESDAEDVGGDFRVAAVRAVQTAMASAEAGEEFFDGASARNFGVGAGNSRDGVRIAAGDGDFVETMREDFGAVICLAAHLSVAGFEGGNVGGEPLEVFEFAMTGEARENVIDAEKEFPFGEVHDEGEEIFAAVLNFEVVAIVEPVDTEMHLRAAG